MFPLLTNSVSFLATMTVRVFSEFRVYKLSRWSGPGAHWPSGQMRIKWSCWLCEQPMWLNHSGAASSSTSVPGASDPPDSPWGDSVSKAGRFVPPLP